MQAIVSFVGREASDDVQLGPYKLKKGVCETTASINAHFYYFLANYCH
jgi:hypothetical protein